MKNDTLYYDGQCPLCRAEMSRLGQLADDSLRLVDIHGLDIDAGSRLAMLRILHLESSSGETLLGLDANVAAWQHTRWGVLFSWLRWPVIRYFADRIYAIWAARRFRRMYGPECRACNFE